jgi:TRAP transporter TAXI family solute receptor
VLEFSKRWEDKKVSNMNILRSFLSTKIFGKARYRWPIKYEFWYKNSTFLADCIIALILATLSCAQNCLHDLLMITIIKYIKVLFIHMKQLLHLLCIALMLVFNCNFSIAYDAARPKKPVLEDKLMVIGTGAVMGVYYPTGGAVCRLINKERKNLGIRCSVEPTPGSIYNIEALKNAEIDFAIIQSDWQEHSYNGTGVFSPKGRYDKLRHVLSLHNEAITVIVNKNSKINKFDDIKGHVVNVGLEGSGVRTTISDIMKAKNWSKADFKTLSELNPADQAKALCKGDIDVMILATGHPNAIVKEVSNMCEIRILEVHDDVIKRFIAGNPQFSSSIIPGGIYAGVAHDIKTFGVNATIVTSSDATESMVYNVSKIIFENLAAFKALHPVLEQLDPIKMANEGRTAPYHDGALKYYQEHGLVQKEEVESH